MASAPGCGQRVAERSSGAAEQKGGSAWLSPYLRNRGEGGCGAAAAYQPAQGVAGLSAAQPTGCPDGVSSLRRGRGGAATRHRGAGPGPGCHGEQESGYGSGEKPGEAPHPRVVSLQPWSPSTKRRGRGNCSQGGSGPRDGGDRARAGGSAPVIEGWIATLLLLLIRGYQLLISPVLGPSCRYLPSCSVYAMDAIRTHGPRRGSWLAIRRVCRCHPFHSCGYDPVPGGEQRGS